MCSCAFTASARSNAATVTPTTMSVSVNACTTGSTARRDRGASEKIGAVPCLRYPIASRSTYVPDCATDTQSARWIRFLLVTMPNNPTSTSHTASR